jgi:signal transduction histidine kinase
VIVPNSDRIDIEYLYNQFYTALVKGQIQRFSNRTVLFQIPTSKLKKVVIPTMSLPAQKEFVATQGLSIKSLEKKIEKEEKEEKSIEEEKEASQDEVVRTFVHQIRAKIQTIDNNMYMADQITRKHGLLDFKLDVEGSVGIGENPTLGEYLQLVLDQSYHLQKELEFIREVMKFNIHQDKIEKKKIKKFFQNWAEDQNKGVGRKIKIVISGQDAEVEFSPAAFRAIADQVYRNTIDHAFGEKYIEVSIQIEIINKEKTALILISNNGEPSEIDFEDFIQPFKKRNGSNGSGIGGNYISRIVKAHQGDIKQIRMSEGFGFKIEIPKKRIL